MYEHSIGDESREGTKDDTLVIIVGLIYIYMSLCKSYAGNGMGAAG